MDKNEQSDTERTRKGMMNENIQVEVLRATRTRGDLRRQCHILLIEIRIGVLESKTIETHILQVNRRDLM
jgi:hypothetical protein